MLDATGAAAMLIAENGPLLFRVVSVFWSLWGVETLLFSGWWDKNPTLISEVLCAKERRKGDRERRRVYFNKLYSRSAISRSTAHDETRRRHLCYCSNE